jgi:hypothetical protein
MMKKPGLVREVMNIIFTVSGFYSNAADTVAYYKE